MKEYLTFFKMSKGRIKINESQLRQIVKESVRRIIREDFAEDFNNTRDNFYKKHHAGMFGFEMKNPKGEWEYGDITYDPNTNTMSCMGVSIEVENDMSVDDNLQGLYEKMMEEGFMDESFNRGINEGIYNTPDGIDHIILDAENDIECIKQFENIAYALWKLKRRGKELSVDKLVDSGVMKHFQQLCFRKFKEEQKQFGLYPNSPRLFREYESERMIRKINNGEYDTSFEQRLKKSKER